MQIDISSLITDAAAKILAPENLAPKVEKALDEAIKNAIDDAMGYRSKFREMLNETMAGAMPGGVDGVTKIGELVAKRVADLITTTQDNALSQLIDKQLAELVETPPAEMKVSKLFAELTRRWDRTDYDKPEGGAPTFIVQRGSHGWINIYLDKNADQDESDCEFEVCISESDSEILLFRIRGEDSGMRTRTISRRWNDELYLTRLFVGKTKFILDVSEGTQHNYYYAAED
jgi:hypothetical protein